jgi:hypothetical protein
MVRPARDVEMPLPVVRVDKRSRRKSDGTNPELPRTEGVEALGRTPLGAETIPLPSTG